MVKTASTSQQFWSKQKSKLVSNLLLSGGKCYPKNFWKKSPPSWLKRNNMFVLKGWLTKKNKKWTEKHYLKPGSSKQAMACFFRVFPGWQVWFRRILAPDASSQGHKSGFFWEGFGVWPNCRISGCKCGDLVGERKTPKKLPWDFGWRRSIMVYNPDVSRMVDVSPAFFEP